MSANCCAATKPHGCARNAGSTAAFTFADSSLQKNDHGNTRKCGFCSRKKLESLKTGMLLMAEEESPHASESRLTQIYPGSISALKSIPCQGRPAYSCSGPSDRALSSLGLGYSVSSCLTVFRTALPSGTDALSARLSLGMFQASESLCKECVASQKRCGSIATLQRVVGGLRVSGSQPTFFFYLHEPIFRDLSWCIACQPHAELRSRTFGFGRWSATRCTASAPFSLRGQVGCHALKLCIQI